jgi:Asp-tRNA(Asn)/Glu-tRNA(Gln) amidotransferase A subunit family amidase
MAYPRLTERPGAVETAAAIRRGEMSPYEAVEAALAHPNLPSTVLPVGDTGGLPCGMQVISPRWGDLDCIAAAEAIGQILHG